MKQSFTYSGNPKTRKDAVRKAKKMGVKFSELVEKLLQGFNEDVFMIQKTYDRPGLTINKGQNKFKND